MEKREPIEVKVNLTSEGMYIPRSFRWNDKNVMIMEIGRRWVVNGSEHMLVLVEPIKNVHELIRDEDGRWYVKTDHSEDTVVRGG
jgi:hypothetical protein